MIGSSTETILADTKRAGTALAETKLAETTLADDARPPSSCRSSCDERVGLATRPLQLSTHQRIAEYW